MLREDTMICVIMIDPGSGKTQTLAFLLETVSLAARDVPEAAMGPVLACADTNAAVDNLVELLLRRGIHVVRVGQPFRVRSSLRHVTLVAQAERLPIGEMSLTMRKEALELRDLAIKVRSVNLVCGVEGKKQMFFD